MRTFSLVLVVTAMVACGGDDTHNTPGSPWVFEGDGGGIEGGGPREDEGPPSCDIPFVQLQVDIQNCGGCDLLCNLDDTDRCQEGVCSCGPLLGGPCPTGQDCRAGICVSPDPDGRVCEFDGECQVSEEGDATLEGSWWCIESRCTRTDCTEEVCDGVDNDCDDLVDETLEGLPMTRWCPEGVDFDTLLPPCEQGVQFCQSGEWSPCRGAHLPVREIGTLACDGRDNDCDGCVDGTGPSCTPVRNTTYDIVFVLDRSGSLDEEQAAVIDAMTMFADRFSRPEFRYALVEMPAPPRTDAPVGWSSPWWSHLTQDLTDYDSFIAILPPLLGVVNGDQEPSWDTIAYLGEEFRLTPSWNLDSTRIIIMITDEEGQTLRATHADPADPPESRTVVSEEVMCASLVHGEVLAVVTDPFYNTWFDLCGQMFELTTDAITMADAIATIITDPCEEDLAPTTP